MMVNPDIESEQRILMANITLKLITKIEKNCYCDDDLVEPCPEKCLDGTDPEISRSRLQWWQLKSTPGSALKKISSNFDFYSHIIAMSTIFLNLKTVLQVPVKVRK